MGLLPMGTGDWLAFETRGLVRSLYTCKVKTLSNICFTGTGNITVLMRLYHTCEE